jgi:hypothetical protein
LEFTKTQYEGGIPMPRTTPGGSPRNRPIVGGAPTAAQVAPVASAKAHQKAVATLPNNDASDVATPRDVGAAVLETPDADRLLTQYSLEMLRVDFDNIYKVNLAALDERLHVVRLSISIFAAPFLVLTALVSTSVVDPEQLASFETVPNYLDAFVLLCGIVNIVPLLRFIEVTGTHMRTARAINNFRQLYSGRLEHLFRASKWNPNLPVDPNYPPTFSVFSWPSLYIAIVSIANACYISIGVTGLDSASPISGAGITILMIFALVQYGIYYLRYRIVKNLGAQPTNPQQYPRIET